MAAEFFYDIAIVPLLTLDIPDTTTVVGRSVETQDAGPRTQDAGPVAINLKEASHVR